MVVAQDTLMSETFVSQASTLQHEAASIQASFDALDAYDLFDPPTNIADMIVNAYADVDRNDSDAREQVSAKIDAIDAEIDKHIKELVVEPQDAGVLFAAFESEGAAEYDAKYMFEATDAHGNRRVGGVGVLGAMVAVYNDAGEQEFIDSPVTWGEYLKSPDKADWTDVIVSEVQKLEDADGGRGTWIKVPRSE